MRASVALRRRLAVEVVVPAFLLEGGLVAARSAGAASAARVRREPAKR